MFIVFCRSIPPNRLKEIIAILENDVMVRCVLSVYIQGNHSARNNGWPLANQFKPNLPEVH